MNNTDMSKTAGTLSISQDVIATIANYTTADIAGVASLAPFASNITSSWLLRNKTSKPVVVELNDDVAIIEIHVNLKFGAKIPEVSKNIQEAVKSAVQNMTGVTVSKVNVYVLGVTFEDPTATTQEA